MLAQHSRLRGHATGFSALASLTALSALASYRFSCNGGRKHTAAEMTQIGTYNALIGEHAFYSSSNTSETR